MPVTLIESLDHEGRGIAHVEGKTIFIEGALPGERVEYASYRRKPNYEQAQVVQILRASSQRVTPGCPHFGVCGGCSMQHLAPSAQTAAKQRVLEDALWHLARLRPEVMYGPVTSATWGYRQRARLSVRHVPKKGGVLVGFHEKRSSYVAVMDQCPVLPPLISGLLPKLKTLVARMSTPDRLPQIEVSVGDSGGETLPVLVLRNLEALTPQDEELLRQFADGEGVIWYLQPGGPATAHLFHPLDRSPLAYSLPDFGLSLRFQPTEFTQVNHGVNRVLVRRAMALLRPAPGERIADMFCGLGNFTLPIARLGATVVGIEGSKELVARGRANAALNGLAERCEYGVANLFQATPESLAALGHFDKMLIDPPREGAVELVKAIGEDGPRRIVYVSCKPATLARDAAILVHEKGYRLKGAGIANMFPHTSHVESIALFERE
ncbi:23S rRNA (uracil(1939)-C(5))-methyltransferase RlmD [Denitratisoma oestradiolicum]|uniref:23S rRNA (uracil(1939)-C(5))-methyltransferase RlmD n=1 Tax=Denitratisoma oestradiolicum TaxID=311182 RepID=A0A6S6YN69_9PROT|nr:23S rRNA (uracil(1939)-C(5))-methyltransferase RlmD [Denitratisoma oestradiolicum]TWO82246.1 23S rRNA (uracil(1939)-C(5))-methyltransferase [Denitratisoma oestradiolicum]CAB1369196.1 23S rRNA (uracil(1939)-C(5))-methyltransferase RlmD [Denitratisoma oestradiolicum]